MKILDEKKNYRQGKFIKTDRTKYEKSVKKYYDRARFAARVLRHIPFIRCIILTGSLARGDANAGSDIDLLLIGKSGRLFTMRFFATAWMTLLGIKRSNDPRKNYAGKICLNYYLADNYLQIPTGRGERIDRYSALNYSKAKFMAGDYKIFEQFLRINQKLFKKYHCVSRITYQVSGENPGPVIAKRKQNRHISHFSFHKPFFEKILSGRFGDWLERMLKAMQIRRIERDPIVQKYPDLIVYNDHELRFHPPKTVESRK